MSAKVLKAIIGRSGGHCEARMECDGRSAVLSHHRKRAGRIDTVANCMRLCLDCHTWIHANVALSYEFGFLVRSTDDPERDRILVGGRRPIPLLTLSRD